MIVLHLTAFAVHRRAALWYPANPWKTVVRNVVVFDAERIADDLCGQIAVVTVDGLFKKIGHCVYSSRP